MFHDNNPLLGTLTHRLTQEDLFDRDRKQPRTRALGLLLHHAGLSCRKTSQLVSLLAEPVTHNPISAWYRRASHLFREQPVQRHERLVIDETSLHIENPPDPSGRKRWTRMPAIISPNCSCGPPSTRIPSNSSTSPSLRAAAAWRP